MKSLFLVWVPTPYGGWFDNRSVSLHIALATKHPDQFLTPLPGKKPSTEAEYNTWKWQRLGVSNLISTRIHSFANLVPEKKISNIGWDNDNNGLKIFCDALKTQYIWFFWCFPLLKKKQWFPCIQEIASVFSVQFICQKKKKSNIKETKSDALQTTVHKTALVFSALLKMFGRLLKRSSNISKLEFFMKKYMWLISHTVNANSMELYLLLALGSWKHFSGYVYEEKNFTGPHANW